MHRFYAPATSFTETSIKLDADETRHLRDVLRMRAGGEVSVFDGEGREFKCSITQIEKRSTDLKIIEDLTASSPESPLDITLAAAVLKGDRSDLVVQKAVELGVTRLIPLSTVRCDISLKAIRGRVHRWRRIALEATKQSGRARLLQVSDPVTLDDLLAQRPGTAAIVLFSERDGASFSTLSELSSVIVVLGPEGGWDDSELQAAATAGVAVITLGGRILRAETAAIAIAAILQHRYGDLN